MCIHRKIDVVFDECTPESQTGGVKGSDTVEHLSLLMMAILDKTEEGEGIIFSFADITKCFDNIFLEDSNFFLLINQVNPKALKEGEWTGQPTWSHSTEKG